jgi:hypothetical protein
VNFDPRRLIPPAIALMALILIGQQTMAALNSAGWKGARSARKRVESPYSGIDRLLAAQHLTLPPRLRDPFGFVVESSPVAVVVRPHDPVRPVELPKPVLTSIIWDQDPRATVRYDGRDFSIRQNSLFADFMVRQITPTEVVLDRGSETLVLKLRPKGD